MDISKSSKEFIPKDRTIKPQKGLGAPKLEETIPLEGYVEGEGGPVRPLTPEERKNREKDSKTLKQKLSQFQKDRKQQRDKIAESFDKIAEGITKGKELTIEQLSDARAQREREDKLVSEYMTELFAVNKELEKGIERSVENAINPKDFEFDIGELERTMIQESVKNNFKDFIEDSIRENITILSTDVDFSDQIKEKEKQLKNAQDSLKDEKKIDKQIKFMESILNGKKVKFKEVAEVLELPTKIKNVSLEERRKRQDDIDKREKQLETITLEINKYKKEINDIDEFLQNRVLGSPTQKTRNERVARKKELNKELEKLQKEIKNKKINREDIDKDKRELNAIKLERQNFNRLLRLNNQTAVKREIKSLKQKKQSLKLNVEVAESKLELTLINAKASVDEKEFENIFDRLEEYSKLAVKNKMKEVGDLSRAGLNKKINDSKLKIIAEDKKKALDSFDETTEVAKTRIENAFKQRKEDARIAAGGKRPQAKESVAFSVIFNEIQDDGSESLKRLKRLLKEKGFQQYLSILDEKILTGENFKQMSEKEKNDFILDNMPRFKEYYVRLIQILDDLEEKVQTGTNKKKIDDVKTLITDLQRKFKIPKKEKEKRKQSPIRFSRGFKADDEIKDEKTLLAAEEKLLYGYFFANSRVNNAKKKEAILTDEVNKATRTFWETLDKDIETFTKNSSNYEDEKEFEKALMNFIGQNTLHIVDILNLIGSKRNNKIRNDVVNALKKEKFVQDLRVPTGKTYSKDRKKGETLEQKIARQKKEGRGASRKVRVGYKVKERKKFEPKDPRFSQKESMLKAEIGSDKESMDKRILDWGKLSLEDARDKARELRSAERVAEEFDRSNAKAHEYFSKEKSKESKNRFFSFVDVNKKGEVVVRGFSYKKGDEGYDKIEKLANKIFDNLEKTVMFKGQETTVLDVINKLVRSSFKYKAGRVDVETKERAREQFGKIIEETIKNIKIRKNEQFRIPKFFKTRLKQDAKVFKRDLMNTFNQLGGKYPINFNVVTKKYEEINNKIIFGAEELQKRIFDIYEEINSMPKKEPQEKDIDTVAEEMMMQSSLYARKERQLNKLLNNFDKMEKEIESQLENKKKFLLLLQERIEEKMQQKELKAQRKIVTALQRSEEIIKEEIAELESGNVADKMLLEHISKFVKFTQKEREENKRMLEALESGEGKRTKRGIRVPAKEEDE